MSVLADLLAVGIATPAPGPRDEALALIASESAVFERHPEFIGADGLPSLGGFVPGCLSERDAVQRVAYLLNAAYADCMAALPPGTDANARWRLVLTLPPWLSKVHALRDQFLATVRAMKFDRVRKVDFVFGGHVAGLRALETAVTQLAEDEAVLWAGADTLVAPLIQDALASAGLAHHKDNPYAMIPGEGAAVWLLGRPDGAALPMARLRALAFGTDPEKLDDPERGPLGTALLDCLRKVQSDLAHGALPGALMIDGNGERHRAEEMAVILSRLAGGNPALEQPLMPFQSTGDMGAAAAPLFAALMPHLADAPSAHVLVALADNAGDRGAAMFDRV